MMPVPKTEIFPIPPEDDPKLKASLKFKQLKEEVTPAGTSLNGAKYPATYEFRAIPDVNEGMEEAYLKTVSTVTGTLNGMLGQKLVRQAIHATPNAKEIDVEAEAVSAALGEMRAKDALERLIITQMVSLHNEMMHYMMLSVDDDFRAVARGPEEHLMPINVGLMMFNENPEQFFPYTRIEVVEFRDQEGNSFSEKIFKGPIHKQLSEALRYIQSMYIREEVRKIPDRAEADRFYNYPYQAIEESLANAIYHRDYKKREPIEVRIHPDRIEIQSFPGPLPPITMEELNKGQQIKVREYRNRRIGDLLKELHLTEGRCTGIPKIQRSMRDNDSPEALFETDKNRSYFLTTLPIHPALRAKSLSESTQLIAESTQLTTKSTQLTSSEWPESLRLELSSLGSRPDKQQLRKVILALCSIRPLSATELSTILGRKSKKALVRDHLTPLKKENLLQIDNPNAHAANQKYGTTVTES